MHTMWKGAISFGLVHIPVKMYAATEDKGLPLRMLHEKCSTPIKTMRSFLVCETEVAWAALVRLRWSEVAEPWEAADFHLRNAAERLRRVGDLWLAVPAQAFPAAALAGSR